MDNNRSGMSPEGLFWPQKKPRLSSSIDSPPEWEVFPATEHAGIMIHNSSLQLRSCPCLMIAQKQTEEKAFMDAGTYRTTPMRFQHAHFALHAD